MNQIETPDNSSSFTIISGGQTGADRAALDFAIQNGISHGGWCPAGRKAEDGVIPKFYNLKETRSANYPSRTKKNLLESDATVVFTVDGRCDRGTELTIKLLKQFAKPHIVITGTKGVDNAAKDLDEFLSRVNPKVLNIAGPRQSFQPEVYNFTVKVLSKTRWIHNKIRKLISLE